jgi:two-component system phosphate regulon response regulator PhoB
MPTVLLVDDEPDVVDLVRLHLRRAGMEIVCAADGDAALHTARTQRPDAIVLDVMMPGLDGLAVCARLRSDPATAAIPIVMLTAKGQVDDRIGGLERGADDYVTKPFSPRELVLRVQAVLRRVRAAQKSAAVAVDEFRIDKDRVAASVAGAPLDLTVTEFKLLALLVERRGRVQSRDTLLTEVWGYRSGSDTRTVDTHMRRLREKLGAHASRIETVRGEGYRFRATPA